MTYRVVIAPDSLKGTATSDQAAEALAAGVREAHPDADIVLVPMADGGEGTSAIFGGQSITLPTTDAMGRLTEATYTLDGETAYIDIAAASGLPAVEGVNDPLVADTYGTGVLIADAQTRGATRIVLCLGGSATVDGGMGILVALGAMPHDRAGHPLPKGGAVLDALGSIDTAQLNIPAAAMEWVLLADVTAPATGPEGAAAAFGPQKGASPADVEALDRALERLVEVTGVDGTQPGMGAAGAAPVGITWLSTLLHGDASHVTILPGAQVVARAQGLAELVESADLVIGAEGAVDRQSFRGKVLGMLYELAGSKLAVAAGRISDAPHDVLAVELNSNPDVTEQLRDAGYRIMSAVQG